MTDHLTVVNHPLVQHKLTLMREKETSTAVFRQLLREISQLLAYEVKRNLPMPTKHIETPMQGMDAPVLDGKKLALISILRAGNGLLDGVLELIPSARVGFVGLYRDEKTLQPVQYYFKVPDALEDRLVIAVELLRLRRGAMLHCRFQEFVQEKLVCGGEIKGVPDLGVEVAIVIGGGNIIRGLAASHRGIDRVTGDYMGMLATVINALALQDTLEKTGVTTRVQTAIEIRDVAEPFIRRRAIRHLEKDRVVIFAAGTGNPYFTTDSAAALRANEVHAEALLKATSVQGVYTADPNASADAELIRRLTYQQFLERNLRVMDAAAISLCRDNGIPIIIFKLMEPGNILRVVCGEEIGSVVTLSLDDKVVAGPVGS